MATRTTDGQRGAEVMECWSVLPMRSLLIFPLSITPLLHHSTAPFPLTQ